MGQSFEDPSQNNPYNSHFPSYHNHQHTAITPVFGNEEHQLNFEDLLRVQEEQGESSSGRLSSSSKAETSGGGGGDPYTYNLGRTSGSGPPSRQNSGDSYRPSSSSNGTSGFQQQGRHPQSQGSSSSGGFQFQPRRPSKRQSTTEEVLIARLQREAQEQSILQEQSQRNLQLQHLARIGAESQGHQQANQNQFPDQHIPGSEYRLSYHNPNPSSSDHLDFRQGEDSASYLSDQEQQELLQYLNNSAGLSSGDPNHQLDFAQTVEAGPSFHPPSLHSAPPIMPNNNHYHTHVHLGQEQFSSYRTTHSASVSPQPSPAFRTAQIHELPLNQDPLVLDGSQYRHGSRLSVAGQGQAQGFRGGHQRNRSFGAQSVSSYAGSIHGGGLETLEGLEDQFAAGLGGPAEGYEGSDFGGLRAAGMGMMSGVMNGPPQGIPFGNNHEFMASFSPRSGMINPALAGRPGRFQGPSRQWSEDDHGGASDATAQWRANLKAQMTEDGSERMLSEETVLVKEPMTYDPHIDQGVDVNRIEVSPRGSRFKLNTRTGPQEPMSEFARRMNSEASDYTLESMASSGETHRNEPVSGNLVDEQFQREVMNMLRSQMNAADRETQSQSQGLAMPPLPIGGAVPPPRGQPLQGPATTPQQFLERVQGQVRSMAPPTFVSSPHFKSAGTFNQTKPHSPPALTIPDSGVSSPKSQPVQMPYPHQRSQEPVPSQLRHHHHPESMPPPPVPSLGGAQMQSQIPAQNNMFLGIPSGGNLTMKDSYLSPIGPGGPSINIVPSTPISGLKDGKGIWEKLAMQAQAAQGSDSSQSAGISAPSLTNHLESSAEKTSRRASHSGNYIQRAPMQLDIATANQALFQMASAPNTAPYAAGAAPDANRALTAPFLRQRSRSEGQMQNLFSQFDIEAIRQLFGDQGSDEALSVSGHSSGGMSNPPDAAPAVDPKMVMAASFGTTGNYQYDTSNLRGSGGSDAGHGEQASQDAQGMSDAAAFAALVGGQNGEGGQSSYVITGVDPNGTTYILTRDGRRLSFDSRMARNLALMNPTSPDFQQTTFHGSITGEDVHMEHPDSHLGVSNGSFRGRPFSRGAGHVRAVKSEDLRTRDDGFDDGR